MTFTIAFNYGGRAEIVDAVRALVADGRRPPTRSTEKAIRAHLYDPEMPDPDLMIRTSGEYRISNFLLWELAYSELVFTDVLWPDFRREHLFDAVREYQRRDRRFGAVEEPSSRCRSTATRASCCAPGSSARPTASSCSSPRAAARCGPSPRACARPKPKFGARLEPTSHVALQLYEGRELDIVTQAETIDHFRAVRDDLDRLTRATALLEAVDPIAQERRGRRPPLHDARRRPAHARRPTTTRCVVPGVLPEAAGPRGLPAPWSTRCAACGDDGDLVAFDLDEGGAAVPASTGGARRSSPEAVRPAPARSSAAGWARRSTQPAGAATHEVEHLATRALEHHLERRLRSVAPPRPPRSHPFGGRSRPMRRQLPPGGGQPWAARLDAGRRRAGARCRRGRGRRGRGTR